MVNLVLDDLRSPAGKGLDTGLEFLILPLDFDGLIAFTGTGVSQKRKTALLGIIKSGHFDDLGIGSAAHRPPMPADKHTCSPILYHAT